MKRMCCMCHIPKEETEFRFIRTKGTYYGYCKNCERLYLRDYRRGKRELERLAKKDKEKSNQHPTKETIEKE